MSPPAPLHRGATRRNLWAANGTALTAAQKGNNRETHLGHEIIQESANVAALAREGERGQTLRALGCIDARDYALQQSCP